MIISPENDTLRLTPLLRGDSLVAVESLPDMLSTSRTNAICEFTSANVSPFPLDGRGRMECVSTAGRKAVRGVCVADNCTR